MNNKKVAMLIMVDGLMLDEVYFEFSNMNDDWNSDETTADLAQWFFY